MKIKMSKYSVAGFSLVELMVVVAIIGILAAVAIPNFSKFQRRARAAEGKSALGSFYNAEKSFQAEWEGFAASLIAIGFGLEGQARTDLDSGGTAATSDATNYTTRYLTEAGASATTAQLAGAERHSVLCDNATYGTRCDRHSALAAWPDPTGCAAGFTAGNSSTDGTFTACAATDVGSGTDDRWTINELKQMSQNQDGINVN